MLTSTSDTSRYGPYGSNSWIRSFNHEGFPTTGWSWHYNTNPQLSPDSASIEQLRVDSNLNINIFEFTKREAEGIEYHGTSEYEQSVASEVVSLCCELL